MRADRLSEPSLSLKGVEGFRFSAALAICITALGVGTMATFLRALRDAFVLPHFRLASLLLPITPRAGDPFNLVIAYIEALEANTRVITEHLMIYPGQNCQLEASEVLKPALLSCCLEYSREHTCLCYIQLLQNYAVLSLIRSVAKTILIFPYSKESSTPVSLSPSSDVLSRSQYSRQTLETAGFPLDGASLAIYHGSHHATLVPRGIRLEISRSDGNSVDAVWHLDEVEEPGNKLTCY